MKRTVGLGANVLDTLISMKGFPTEDTKSRADGIMQAGGGPVGNALVIMSKLGVSAEVIGAFANDTAGEVILAELKEHGVKTERASVISASSFTSYIILSAEGGSRTCVYDRGTVPDSPELTNLSAIDGADVLHLDGNYLKCAIHAARYAKEKGVKVSLDAGGLYDGIEELLPLVDILIPSAEFAMGLTKKATPKDALLALREKYSPEILAVTDGAEGGYYFDGSEVHHYDSFKIRPIDTNGAGDTFHGAFIAAYLDGMKVGDCCRFASATSAYKCLHSGVRSFELTKALIFEFIKKYGEK